MLDLRSRARGTYDDVSSSSENRRQRLDTYTNICPTASDGRAYNRFERALEVGNLTLLRAAAAELPRVGIHDALRVCLLLRDDDPALYDRAAVRWTGRFAVDARGAELQAIQTAAAALDALPDTAAEAIETLAGLCAAYAIS
jgi:hypothetical protein